MKHAGPDRKSNNAKTIAVLSVVIVAMFGFGYALVPLYDMFCDAFGINGKTGVTTEQKVQQVDESRLVTVVFTGNTSRDLPWEFHPQEAQMQVHPGAVAQTTFFAKNTSGRDVIGRAIPSVDPNYAGPHFKKTECFCFTEQKLAAGEAKDMVVRFVVDPDLPKEVETITLSYSFFNADKYAKGAAAKTRTNTGS